MKKYLPHLLIALALIVVSGLGINYAQANGNHRSEIIINRLAEKFNLDKTEVEQVFAKNRAKRQQQMQARLEENLDQAVEDGKLTEEQKNLLLDKRAEMKDEMKNLSWNERQEKRAEHRQEIQNWAKENGIDLSAIRNQGMKNGQKGFGVNSK